MSITKDYNLNNTMDFNNYLASSQQPILNEIFKHFSKNFRFFDEEDERYIYNEKLFKAFEQQYQKRKQDNPKLIIKYTKIYIGDSPCWVLHR